jgi:hypothetical protein
VLSKAIAGSSDFSLRYRYDPANRLVGIDEVVDPSPLEVRPLKEFHYARTNDGPDRRAGKLVSSKRTNWVDPINPLFGGESGIPITITQSYRYEGRDGRISARQTRAVIGVGHYAFLTELEWTHQGNLDLLRYPRCLHAGCVGEDSRHVPAEPLAPILKHWSRVRPEFAIRRLRRTKSVFSEPKTVVRASPSDGHSRRNRNG